MGFTIPAIATQHATPLSGAFCVSGGGGVVDEPTGSANSSGTNLDHRRSAPSRKARRGEPPGCGSQSPPSPRNTPLHRSGRFAYLAEMGASTTEQGPLTRPLLPSVPYKPQNL